MLISARLRTLPSAAKAAVKSLKEEAAASIAIRRHAKWLKPRLVREKGIGSAGCILVVCLRNEMPRIPAFLAYYRHLGVEHFLFIDNESTDGLADYLSQFDDCSVWLGQGSYKATNFGMDWCNYLLNRYGTGKWCVTVDPDEFLVFPYCEQRGLKSLTGYMDRIGQKSLFTVMIDAYSSGRLSETVLTADTDPFRLCPYFDRFNLCQRFSEEKRSFWVQGGVRMRRFFAEDPLNAPALNKVPLVKWRRGYRYVSSMHHLNTPAINCTVYDDPTTVSGILFHFKYVNLLQQKATEEMVRNEHYAGSKEYCAYLEAGDVVLFDPNISVRYKDSRQMQELGFMQAGGWY